MKMLVIYRPEQGGVVSCLQSSLPKVLVRCPKQGKRGGWDGRFDGWLASMISFASFYGD